MVSHRSAKGREGKIELNTIRVFIFSRRPLNWRSTLQRRARNIYSTLLKISELCNQHSHGILSYSQLQSQSHHNHNNIFNLQSRGKLRNCIPIYRDEKPSKRGDKNLLWCVMFWLASSSLKRDGRERILIHNSNSIPSNEEFPYLHLDQGLPVFPNHPRGKRKRERNKWNMIRSKTLPCASCLPLYTWSPIKVSVGFVCLKVSQRANAILAGTVLHKRLRCRWLIEESGPRKVELGRAVNRMGQPELCCRG